MSYDISQGARAAILAHIPDRIKAKHSAEDLEEIVVLMRISFLKGEVSGTRKTAREAADHA